MAATIRELAQWLEGELVGSGELSIQAARPLDEAQAGDITFAVDERRLEQLHHCPASAAVVPLGTPANGKPLIRVRDPLMTFARLVERFRPRPPASLGIHPSACLHSSAEIGAGTNIEPFVVVGPGSRVGARCRIGNGASIGANCRLGDDVVLHPHVVLYDGTILGDRVEIHANSVMGADGFGYRQQEGGHAKVPQLGHVEIGDDVEIGACTTIDKGTFGPTRIGAGTKIDNLVMIGHNCQIGRRNLLCSQVGIAGSSNTGDQVVMAGQVGVRDHVHVGAGAVILAQSGVCGRVADGARLLGYPALPESVQRRIWVTLEKLPAMRRALKRLQKHLGMADDEE